MFQSENFKLRNDLVFDFIRGKFMKQFQEKNMNIVAAVVCILQIRNWYFFQFHINQNHPQRGDRFDPEFVVSKF